MCWLEFAPKLTSTSAAWLRSRRNPTRLRTSVRARAGFRSGIAIHASEKCEISGLGETEEPMNKNRIEGRRGRRAGTTQRSRAGNIWMLAPMSLREQMGGLPA